jgi:hypothetical protein
MYKLWCLAQRASLLGWKPCWFWRWLLKVTDRYYGYRYDFD